MRDLPPMKPLLVGEANPYGGDPRYALYPDPPRSAGARLCYVILGFRAAHHYIGAFDRCNLCPEKWSAPVARRRAAELLREAPGRTLVLFGAKVAGAFGLNYRPFVVATYDSTPPCRMVMLPHPSGRSRGWDEPGSIERARALLREVGALP